MAINVPKIVYDNPEIIILFDYPPSDDFRNENIKSNSKQTISSNGNQQTQFNYMENVSKLSFTYVSESLKNQLQTFFTNWSLRGKEFKYFEDQNEAGFKLVTLSERSFSPVILFPSSILGEYVYEFKIGMRELL